MITSGFVLLNLTVFSADLKDMTVSRQVDHTEMTLFLNGAPDGLRVEKQGDDLLTVTFNGNLLSQAGHPLSQILYDDRYVRSIYWSELTGQVKGNITLSNPQATYGYKVLTNPDRVVIEVENPTTATAPPPSRDEEASVISGVVHRHMIRNTARGPMNINVLEIDPSTPGLSIEPVLPAHNLHGKAKVAQMVDWNKGLAGINAAYFKPDTGTSLGAMIINREFVSGPIYQRVALGMRPDRHFEMARLSFGGRLTTSDHKLLTLHNVNQPRLSAHEYIVYNYRWGTKAPKTPKNGMQIQIDRGKVTQVSGDQLAIPRNGYVVVGPAKGVAKSMQPGDPAQIQFYTTPDWSNMVYAISGGPFLMKDGHPYVDNKAQRFISSSFLGPAPRTAVGITRDNKLILVTVDGRKPSVSVGMTLWELARLMKELGCEEAMNLDGGSSTQMVLQGHLVNVPSVAGGARVSSALVVRHNEETADTPSGPSGIVGIAPNGTIKSN